MSSTASIGRSRGQRREGLAFCAAAFVWSAATFAQPPGLPALLRLEPDKSQK